MDNVFVNSSEGPFDDKLAQSAETCVACSILLETIEHFRPEAGFTRFSWALRVTFGILWLACSFQRDGDRDGPVIRRRFDIFLPPGKSIPAWPALGNATDIEAQGRSSDQSLLDLKQSLAICSTTHVECQWQDMPYLPTRVLDVSNGNIKLLETNDRRGEYIALSHCWGKVELMKTLTTNIESHKTHIALGALPKTFQDAVQVTRYLGIRYLWIDSLCIIQNSKEDWELESSRMADVYGCAYVALLATFAKDGRGGLFPASSLKSSITIERELPGIGQIKVCARHALSHQPYHKFANSLSDAVVPLLDRSWCFQEYVLAPRIALFGREEILWECKTGRGCNCGLMSRLALEEGESLKEQAQKAITNPAGEVGSMVCQAADRRHKLWWSLVNAYTKKELTYKSDKLVALSGVARYMQMQTNDKYLAGHWRSRFADELFWRTISEATRENVDDPPEQWFKRMISRPKEYRAPSWSWASVDAQIIHVGKSNKTPDVSRVLRIESEPAGLDATGAVKSGQFLVEGILTQAESWYEGDEIERFDKLKLIIPGADPSPDLTWHADVPSESTGLSGRTLPVYVLWWSFDNQDVAAALILQSDVGHGMFRRLGILDTDEIYAEETYDWDAVYSALVNVAPTRLTIL